MVEAYWQIGKRIVEEEQHGNEKAAYGVALIKKLSVRLTAEFGKGFTEANLWNFRQFYLAFPPSSEGGIPYAVRRELTWTHYRLLMRVENAMARTYYLKEAIEQRWSSRALERQIHSLYYERLLASRNRKPVVKEMCDKTSTLTDCAEDFIKNPYVLEFLNLPQHASFRESNLEQAIIGKLQAFLLELGKGFAFVARQQRISTETKDFFVDLVFYNTILKCFLLIDLKAGELTHQDIGQMDMYVRLYEDKFKSADDNPTIGLILCTERDATVVKYSVLDDDRQLFAAKYQFYMPSKEELVKEIEKGKALLRHRERD